MRRAVRSIARRWWRLTSARASPCKWATSLAWGGRLLRTLGMPPQPALQVVEPMLRLGLEFERMVGSRILDHFLVLRGEPVHEPPCRLVLDDAILLGE